MADATSFTLWSYPLHVLGMNPIASYLISHLLEGFIRLNFALFLGKEFFRFGGQAYEPLFIGLGILTVDWIILAWMERRKIFLRI
jgi:predicted acyltransferase